MRGMNIIATPYGLSLVFRDRESLTMAIDHLESLRKDKDDGVSDYPAAWIAMDVINEEHVPVVARHLAKISKGLDVQ